MDYRVYFTDNNIRLFHSKNGIYDLIAYLFEENYSQFDIRKIEVIENE